MLKRRKPRSISGGGCCRRTPPHPKLLAESRDQFRPPHKGEAMWLVYPPAGFSSVSRVATN
jgi:hypothetical protein